MKKLHDQFTLDFWQHEIELVTQGKGTRNWTVAEQAEQRYSVMCCCFCFELFKHQTHQINEKEIVLWKKVIKN